MIVDLSPALAFLAGGLSILSPCVLPLIPIILGSARSRHPFGPAALGAGLAVSFTSIGLFVATFGFAIGLDADLFRRIGGALIGVMGLVLLIPAAQARLSMVTGPVGAWANGQIARFDDAGLSGQALLGLALGLVWSPCVGPTLGAASLLAAQKQSLGDVALVMAAFGIGAAVPLTLLGAASGAVGARLRDRLRRIGSGGKIALGVLLVLIGVLVVTDLDRQLEAKLTNASPDWLVSLTTRY